jgi:hypothetical protein
MYVIPCRIPNFCMSSQNVFFNDTILVDQGSGGNLLTHRIFHHSFKHSFFMQFRQQVSRLNFHCTWLKNRLGILIRLIFQRLFHLIRPFHMMNLFKIFLKNCTFYVHFRHMRRHLFIIFNRT